MRETETGREGERDLPRNRDFLRHRKSKQAAGARDRCCCTVVFLLPRLLVWFARRNIQYLMNSILWLLTYIKWVYNGPDLKAKVQQRSLSTIDSK